MSPLKGLHHSGGRYGVDSTSGGTVAQPAGTLHMSHASGTAILAMESMKAPAITAQGDTKALGAPRCADP